MIFETPLKNKMYTNMMDNKAPWWRNTLRMCLCEDKYTKQFEVTLEICELYFCDLKKCTIYKNIVKH